jgi:hypothetical protein
MSDLDGKRPNLTYQIPLPGGQRRLREAILYVCDKCRDAPNFGLVKLNKIIWLADFTSYAERGQPITGRAYQRLEFGPAPIEMLPVLNDMQQNGEIIIVSSILARFEERRPVARAQPVMKDFSQGDVDYLNRAIELFWDLTGKEASDKSHGVAWKTRRNGDSMPYELAYLSDQPLGQSTIGKLSRIGKERGWRSQ